jgi:DnaJ-class molecular chaperone
MTGRSNPAGEPPELLRWLADRFCPFCRGSGNVGAKLACNKCDGTGRGKGDLLHPERSRDG